jgi:hypothetical protein
MTLRMKRSSSLLRIKLSHFNPRTVHDSNVMNSVSTESFFPAEHRAERAHQPLRWSHLRNSPLRLGDREITWPVRSAPPRCMSAGT